MSHNQEAKQFPTMDGALEAYETPTGAIIRQKSDNVAIATISKCLKCKREQEAQGIPEAQQTLKYALVMPLGKPEEGKPGHHYDKMWEILEDWDPTKPDTTQALEDAGHVIRGFDNVETAILTAELSYGANNAMVGINANAE
jgi:hypothetical protein